MEDNYKNFIEILEKASKAIYELEMRKNNLGTREKPYIAIVGEEVFEKGKQFLDEDNLYFDGTYYTKFIESKYLPPSYINIPDPDTVYPKFTVKYEPYKVDRQQQLKDLIDMEIRSLVYKWGNKDLPSIKVYQNPGNLTEEELEKYTPKIKEKD